ncbi:ATP-binding cassette glutathione S-conjugate transporter ycf1 [Coemansia sp. S2]|nr:ATP-binding cassette glutathione S-conjugate transporter ycf1 [Coemansia sp. S2]
MAILLSFTLSTSTTGYIWFQAFHLIGVYRALNGSSEVWNSAVCALLHGVLVLTNLDAPSKSLLHQVFQRCTYAQERYLMKLQKLRQVTLNDMWPLPERFQLRTAYSEFKLNKNESYFVLRAIFHMMWRPMIPVYTVGLILQFLPLLRIKLDSSIMHNVDDLSNYSMYMIVADVARIMIVQLLNNQQSVIRQYIKNEMSRAQNAIDIEMFRLPLQRLGLGIKKKPARYVDPSRCIKSLIELPQKIEHDTSEVGPLVEMNNCSFTWGTGDKAKDVLSDVTLNAGAGELVAIVGKTGAGKSSLLLAMCNEVEMTQGKGKLVGKIAYLEQQPWIMNDTLRANILFGREYDEEYYWKVLSACALTDDLEMWPNSDMTVIGENGMNISGGQRARLALARTVYSKADIYFLDDPLSAVDAIVKRHILDNIILSTGMLGDKLRFIATNADNILPLCNQIATVDGGHVFVKVQIPQVYTAFKFKEQTKPILRDFDNAGKELQATSASASKGKHIVSTTGKSTDSIIITSTSSKPPKQWSHWSNALYAIRISGAPILATVIMTVLFDKVSALVLDMYKLDVLRGNSNSMVSITKPLDKRIEELEKEEEKEHNHNRFLVSKGAQMIRLFGVEPYFTNNYITSAESSTRLGMLESTYGNLHYLVFATTRTALHSILLYIYIAMSKMGLYTINAGDVAEFRENCESILAEINEFRNLAERDPEAPYVIDSCRPSAQWPSNGKIEFRDFSMKYGADLGYALKNVNLTINPGEKIGIVGRTGAGKSSLAKVLFRLIHENTSGSILIGGQDISEFGVGDYRPRLGMIPQESTMLNGSIRHNLDPLNQFDIEEVWASLVKCNLSELVSSKEIANDASEDEIKYKEDQAYKREQWRNAGWCKHVMLLILMKLPKTLDPVEKPKSSGLDKSVQDSFKRLSSGQQQLFGLCRVLMRKRKIIVLDEATANVDLETDKSVQELIRKEFGDCTVLTIAHRLETIMNSDRIIVMDKGTIAEIGTPQELLAKDGMFAQLVKTSDFGQ